MRHPRHSGAAGGRGVQPPLEVLASDEDGIRLLARPCRPRVSFPELRASVDLCAHVDRLPRTRLNRLLVRIEIVRGLVVPQRHAQPRSPLSRRPRHPVPVPRARVPVRQGRCVQGRPSDLDRVFAVAIGAFAFYLPILTASEIDRGQWRPRACSAQVLSKERSPGQAAKRFEGQAREAFHTRTANVGSQNFRQLEYAARSTFSPRTSSPRT